MTPRLVIVEWEDTTSVAAWLDKEELQDLATNRAWKCRNVGYLVHEDDKCVVLAARISDDKEHFGLVERIPKRAIVSMSQVASITAVPAVTGRALREQDRDLNTIRAVAAGPSPC